ncbi:MAG: sulfatase-like hydrolase/transferase [Prolixibacteraceae bacterium]
MKNKTYFFVLILSILISACNSAEKKEERPNVLLFFIDDYGYGDISFEGNTQIKTPNIDRIAENGIRFDRFYQSSGACAPTRASLLTGRYYLETGVWGVHRGRDFLKRDEVTIANVLQDNGYATGAFGKWHSGKTLPYFSWNRGFDVGVHPVLYQHFNTRMLYNNKLVNVEGPVTTRMTDQVIRFIENNRDNPFFCYVPYEAIHLPWQCPDEVYQKYRDQGYTEQIALLYGMIEVMDDNVGRVLDKLDELKLAENTVIMFLSDDGPSNNSLDEEGKEQRHRAWPVKYRGGKAGIYEAGSITPFYVQWKNRLPAGKVYHHLSGVIDLFPTILDICGIENYQSKLPLAGKNLWPVMQSEDTTGWEERKYFDNSNFYQIPRGRIDMDRPQITNMSVHHKEFKLIRQDRTLWRNSPENLEPEYMLFNLKNDPTEENNIVDEHPELVNELKKDLDDWYGGILQTERAFGQAVFEVGNWEERISGINPDACFEKKGDVQYGSIFRFGGWTEPGSSLTYDIDVVEEGDYKVHLYYKCDEDKTGARFRVFTPADTAGVVIADVRSSVSETLHLPAGEQKLTIELTDPGPGEQGVREMNYFLVERLIPEGNTTILKNPGFHLITEENNDQQFFADYASTEFLTRGGRQDEPVKLSPGQLFTIKPFADNPDQIEKVEVFKDFEKVKTIEEPPFEFEMNAPEGGYYSLNVSYTTKDGVTNTTRALIQVE